MLNEQKALISFMSQYVINTDVQILSVGIEPIGIEQDTTKKGFVLVSITGSQSAPHFYSPMNKKPRSRKSSTSAASLLHSDFTVHSVLHR